MDGQHLVRGPSGQPRISGQRGDRLIWLVTSFAGDAQHTGGVAAHLDTLARGLEALGYRVRVITRRSLPGPALWLISGLVLLNRLASPLGSYLRARAAAWFLRRHLASAWAKEPPAAIVFEDLHGASPWPVPTLTFVHSLDAEAELTAPRWRPLLPQAWTRLLQQAYLRWELGQAARMPAWATVSDGFWDHLVGRYPETFRPERGTVIYPGLDVEQALPAGSRSRPGGPSSSSAEGPFVLASMGLFVPMKNQGFLLELLARLPERCRLLLLGDGP
ncbi:MAG: glycosyltransferase, partial [Firmicutes bacterium]|nr:glycosyltransferase [Bacillota bacterium]